MVKFQSLLKEFVLAEYSEKILKQMLDLYKQQKPNLDDEQILYYVKRFDQIKTALKKKVEDKDPTVLALLPKDLQSEESLKKNFYLEITRYKRFDALEKLIDGAFSKAQAKKEKEELVNSAETDADKIYDKDNLEIYKGDAEHKCIKYGKNQYYSWCIARTQGSMYSGYRFQGVGGGSRMFYFVFDKTRPDKKEGGRFEDPYHAVVIHAREDGGYAVTDATNMGDKPAKTWDDVIKLLPAELGSKLKGLEYLFKYIKPSSEEIAQAAMKGKKLSFEQFAELSYADKKTYVQANASNRNIIDSNIFKSLDLDLKNECINFGRICTFDELKSNVGLLKRYPDFRFTRYPKEPLPYPFIPYLKDDLQQKYLEEFEDEYLTFDEIEKYFSDATVKKYIDKQIKKFGFLPPEAEKFMSSTQKKIYSIYSISFKDISYSSNPDIENSTMAPLRLVSVAPISAKTYNDLSSQERKLYFELIDRLFEQGNGVEKHSDFFMGVPQMIQINNKVFMLCPSSNNSDVFTLIDENGKVAKDNIYTLEIYKNGKEIEYDSTPAGPIYKISGQRTWYLPQSEYDSIKLLDEDGDEIRFDMNNLEENNELVRKFQKLAGIQTENETKPVTAPPTTKPGVTPKRRTLTPPKPAPKTNPKALSEEDKQEMIGKIVQRFKKFHQ
jgi:hypothetical protein